MTTHPGERVNVKLRTWHDKKHGTHEDTILIYKGSVFVRIPIDQVYEVSNQIVDLVEKHKREEAN